MTAIAQRAETEARPRLVFFYSQRSGLSRRVEGYLAQVLQRRGNHDAFHIHRVEVTQHPELVERFRVEEVPALFVVDGNRVCASSVAPRGCRELQAVLDPWLR
jgi:thioredoxin-like negative regulator of GroEL